jgi:O-antigen biosynthesis protein WbqV
MGRKKSGIIFIHDCMMAALSLLLSLYLRLGDSQFYLTEPYLENALIGFVAISAAMFLLFRVPNKMWRYTSIQDISALVKATTLIVLIFLPTMFVINRLEGFPRSLIVINWFVLLTLLSGPRIFFRMLKERSLPSLRNYSSRKIPVLVVGVNDHTELFIRDLQGNKEADFTVVGILDDDKTMQNRHIRNVKILGGVSDLKKVINKLKNRGKAPQKVIFAPDTVSGAIVSKLLKDCEEAGVSIARLARMTDFKTSVEEKIQLRPIAVEDILGRPQTTLNRKSMKELIKGKVVLITGGGGTIGSELTRQLAGHAPKKIIILDNSEFSLYSIDKEIEEQYPNVEKLSLLADVRNLDLLKQLFKREAPHIIFHAAAIKHVPLSENNICEAAHTNIIGTKNVAMAANYAKAAAMVMISTDKAVNPTNVMGATKRAAEFYIQTMAKGQKNPTTCFATVRFGNVLGSTGSVVPLFKRQLENGGPITVTHKDMTRYFMTVREAVELVLQASVLSSDMKYNGSIFVLDMGEPVYIKDLAKQMIRLAGLKPEEDIKIEYTGVRPGEKLYEELFYENENPQPTDYQGIRLANPAEISTKQIEKLISQLENKIKKYDEAVVLEHLKKIVPEYSQ